MDNVTPPERNDVRSEVRRTIELEAIVNFSEPETGSWKEIASVGTVSRNGIGFVSPRPCEAGRLVNLVLPMPEEFRAFDKSKELYAVHGLVQYCTASGGMEQPGYNVGVALIGKKAPDSYQNDPLQTYRINGMTKSGFWTITETDKAFRPRRFPRYLMSLEVGVSLLQQETRSVVKTTAMTRDIGIGGTAIISTLDAQVGDKVKFACEKLNFYALAIVRNREELNGDESLIRLEFVESEFPVDKLHLVRNDRSSGANIDGSPGRDTDFEMNELTDDSVEVM